MVHVERRHGLLARELDVGAAVAVHHPLVGHREGLAVAQVEALGSTTLGQADRRLHVGAVTGAAGQAHGVSVVGTWSMARPSAAATSTTISSGRYGAR